MTPDQYRAAAKAISDFRWILAAALSSSDIEHSKVSQARMKQLSSLQRALEDKGLELATKENTHE